MKRRVILVDFPWSRDQDPRLPLGHASLLTALRTKTQADVRSIVVPVNGEQSSAALAIKKILEAGHGFRPNEVDIAMGVYVWCEDVAQETNTGLRDHGFAGRIILGGPQISYSGEGVHRYYPLADILVRGYGENALCQLVQDPGRLRIPGVLHAKGLLIDPVDQAEIALDTLPSPWLTQTVPLEGQHFIRWETQRGCPFRCSFCQHREPGQRLKNHSFHEDRTREEIELFCMSGVGDIAVLDPIFNDRTGRATSILEHYVRSGFQGRLSLQCRAELIDDHFLDVARRLRTRLELGIQTIHAAEGEAIRRKNNMALVERALDGIRDRGIDHEVSIIFGLPEQTLASFRETIAFCLEKRIPVIRAFPLMLLRGTELDRGRETWSLEDDGSSMPMVTSSSRFGHAEWYRMAQLAEALKVTERKHPHRLEELSQIAGKLEPTFGRYQPPPREKRAAFLEARL